MANPHPEPTPEPLSFNEQASLFVGFLATWAFALAVYGAVMITASSGGH